MTPSSLVDNFSEETAAYIFRGEECRIAPIENFMRFEGLTPVIMCIAVSCDVTSCSVVISSEN
jgi:hypothetical protein